MLAFLHEMDRALNTTDWTLNRGPITPPKARVARIAVDITEQDSAYILEADLPGFSEHEVVLTVKGKVLTLQGQRNVEARETPTRRERQHLKLRRSFALPDHVQEEALEATLKNGVLKVTMPKSQDAGPRIIPIQTA